MSRLDELLARERRVGIGTAVWLAILLLVSLGLWAGVAELEEVAIAPGRVIPRGQVKVIQHLEGGIVERLFVKNGDRVKAGESLVRLDLGALALNREELIAQMDAARLARARVDSLASGKPLALPPALVERHPDLAENERRLHASRINELRSRQATLDQQLAQRRTEGSELGAKVESLAENLRLSREKLAIGEALRADSLISKLEFLRIQQEVKRFEGEIKISERTIARVRQAGQEVVRAKAEINAQFRRAMDEERTEIARDIMRIRKRLDTAESQAGRALITSPITGVVKNLRYHTVGGVVRSGDPIMEVVPTDDVLVIEAYLNPTDRGYVHPGQSAVVKFMTYDFIRYGGLAGEVIRVAPDTNTRENGGSYYVVMVKTKGEFTAPDGATLAIAPGMEVSVDIHTGKRTVLEYLIRPVLKLKSEALRER